MSAYASVCLLSYDRPQLLEQTIESALRYAGYPFELIVHDDGSGSPTTDMLKEFHAAGKISLLMLNAPGNNEGQGVALNRMFSAATGDPIVKMDHDLVLQDDWLSDSVELLEANAGVGNWQPRIGALGLFKYRFDPVDYRKMFVQDHASDGLPWEEHEDFVGSCMVIPRAAYEKFGPFEMRSPAFAEDAVFKHAIRDSEDWCNALFPYNLAENHGFGLGPSTVNVKGPDGQPTVARIASGPHLVGEES